MIPTFLFARAIPQEWWKDIQRSQAQNCRSYCELRTALVNNGGITKPPAGFNLKKYRNLQREFYRLVCRSCPKKNRLDKRSEFRRLRDLFLQDRPELDFQVDRPLKAYFWPENQGPDTLPPVKKPEDLQPLERQKPADPEQAKYPPPGTTPTSTPGGGKKSAAEEPMTEAEKEIRIRLLEKLQKLGSFRWAAERKERYGLITKIGSAENRIKEFLKLEQELRARKDSDNDDDNDNGEQDMLPRGGNDHGGIYFNFGNIKGHNNQSGRARDFS